MLERERRAAAQLALWRRKGSQSIQPQFYGDTDVAAPGTFFGLRQAGPNAVEALASRRTQPTDARWALSAGVVSPGVANTMRYLGQGGMTSEQMAAARDAAMRSDFQRQHQPGFSNGYVSPTGELVEGGRSFVEHRPGDVTRIIGAGRLAQAGTNTETGQPLQHLMARTPEQQAQHTADIQAGLQRRKNRLTDLIAGYGGTAPTEGYAAGGGPSLDQLQRRLRNPFQRSTQPNVEQNADVARVTAGVQQRVDAGGDASAASGAREFFRAGVSPEDAARQLTQLGGGTTIPELRGFLESISSPGLFGDRRSPEDLAMADYVNAVLAALGERTVRVEHPAGPQSARTPQIQRAQEMLKRPTYGFGWGGP